MNYGEKNKTKMISKGYEINLKIPLLMYEEFIVKSEKLIQTIQNFEVIQQVLSDKNEDNLELE